MVRGGDRYALARERLVGRLRADGVSDLRVLEAINAVVRHELVPAALQTQAYVDRPLFIGEGQTISAPGVVAVMTQALALRGGEKVLEVGTGSGYQAAILSRIAGRVVSIERHPQLATRARRALKRLGIENVSVFVGDGTRGRDTDAPYDAIVVTAGGPEVPQPLLDQLAEGGRLVGPFGERGAQRLLRLCQTSEGFEPEDLGPCRFVDLVGAHGWSA